MTFQSTVSCRIFTGSLLKETLKKVPETGMTMHTTGVSQAAGGAGLHGNETLEVSWEIDVSAFLEKP
jgi:hypothetical protein